MQRMSFLISLIALAFLSGCGDRQSHDDSSAVLSPVEQSFIDAAKVRGVPARLLMASVFAESGLRPDRSSAPYLVGDQPGSKAPSKGESAVGFSFAELGLSFDATLTDQIAAYITDCP